jgi:putative AdoMet-dependent methyltransferase
MALRYSYHARLVTLEGMLTDEQNNYALIRTVDWLDPRHDELGLELGAGSGNLTVMLSASVAKLTIIEQSVEMLAIIRNRLPQVDANGNMLALPLASKSFSFVDSSFALHHLNHSQQLLALEEMDRVLLPGGRLDITGLMMETMK